MEEKEYTYLCNAGAWYLEEVFTSDTIKEFLEEHPKVQVICNYLYKYKTFEVRLKAGKKYATRYIVPEVILNCRDYDIREELRDNYPIAVSEIRECVESIIKGE